MTKQTLPLQALWAMEPTAFARLTDMLHGENFRPLFAQERTVTDPADGETLYTIKDGVAVIELRGLITKYPTFFGEVFGGDIVTGEIEKAIAAAVADSSVSSILLLIDSPGGSVAGTAELADAVYAANQQKPVIAYAEDAAASAAYWIGSQARAVYSNATASVGSIGVYAVLWDWSRAAENAGVRVHVMKSADGKGGGVAGAPVPDATLENMQKLVDAVDVEFRAAVARGRGMTAQEVAAVATGGSFAAKEAVTLGLVDDIRSFAEILGNMVLEAEQNPWSDSPMTASRKEQAMTKIKGSGGEEHSAKGAEAQDQKCPGCGTTNPGGADTCKQCGKTMPAAEAIEERPASEVTANRADLSATIDARLDARIDEKLDAVIDERVNARFAEREKARKAQALADAAVARGVVPVGQRENALKFAKHDPEAFEAFTKTLRAVAPVAGHYVEDAADAGTQPEGGALDMENPKHREQLAKEAAALQAKDSKLPFNEALLKAAAARGLAIQ